ncbi:MAG: GNAT family N-acetyltransferase [Defluviitaleaceae bacterium]|nr:GNAT family N-acetyltransferase [Defluviitaleaceae bacterium]
MDMEFILFDMQDQAMLMSMLPLYQTYEAEISNEALEDIFPPSAFDENFAYFRGYFEGKTTFICVIDEGYKGFVTFHADTKERPGHVDGYEGWGHMSEIYVAKQHRKHGLGKVMVAKAEEELNKLDIKGIYLNDIVGNPHFWKSLNYIDTGIVEPNEGGRVYVKYV